jgi:hypothetical protein
MRQYNKDKPKKWGFKVFALCASKTGLILNFDLYTGKESVEKARSDINSFNCNNHTYDPSIFNCLTETSILVPIVAASSQESEYGLVLSQSSQENQEYILPGDLEFTDNSILYTLSPIQKNSTPKNDPICSVTEDSTLCN